MPAYVETRTNPIQFNDTRLMTVQLPAGWRLLRLENEEYEQAFIQPETGNLPGKVEGSFQ